MKLKIIPLGLIVLVLFAGGILAAQAVGLWQTESVKQASVIATGTDAGKNDPQSIKGSFSFAQIAAEFDLEAEALMQAFTLEGDPTLVKVKDIEAKFTQENVEVGRKSMVAFVSMMTDIAPDLTEIYLPQAAIDLLKAAGKLSPAQFEQLKDHIVK